VASRVVLSSIEFSLVRDKKQQQLLGLRPSPLTSLQSHRTLAFMRSRKVEYLQRLLTMLVRIVTAIAVLRALPLYTYESKVP
jgi:hypothetical protein